MSVARCFAIYRFCNYRKFRDITNSCPDKTLGLDFRAMLNEQHIHALYTAL